MIILESFDDTQIKELLVQHGMATELEPYQGMPTPLRMHCYWHDKDFWYAVTRFVGYPDEIDNGYHALLFPATVPEEEAMKTIHKFTDEGASGPDVYSEYRKTKTRQN